MTKDDDLLTLSAPELRMILEAGTEVHGAEKIHKAREALQIHNKRVSGRWIKFLSAKIAVSLAIVGVFLVIYNWA